MLMLLLWSFFITKIRFAIKILKNQGDVFSFCHKRMQPTALGVKKQVKITIDIDNPSVRLNTGVCCTLYIIRCLPKDIIDVTLPI